MYDDLDVFRHMLKVAEQEYHTLVKTACWSDEICYEADLLEEHMAFCRGVIEEILSSLT